MLTKSAGITATSVLAGIILGAIDAKKIPVQNATQNTRKFLTKTYESENENPAIYSTKYFGYTTTQGFKALSGRAGVFVTGPRAEEVDQLVCKLGDAVIRPPRELGASHLPAKV